MALSQMSTLIVQQQKFNLFKDYLDSTPVLRQMVDEQDHPFFVQLCRDIWFSLCEQRHEPILNADAATENPIRYTVVKQFVSHPTYHCLYDLSNDDGNNTLVNAMIIADFLIHWLQHELNGRSFTHDQQRLQYVLELVSISQAIEGAAQFLAHMQPRLTKERDLCDFLLLDFHEQANENAKLLFEMTTAGVTRHLYKAKYIYESIA